MQRSLYGPDGYYMRGNAGPGFDYRTSTTASPAFAKAIAALIEQVDAELNHPDVFDFVEVAAADGRLLTQLAPMVAKNVRLHGVDLAPRPPHLSETIAWSAEIPQLRGLLFANEWLDNVPIDVIEDGLLQGPDGPVGPPTEEQLQWQQVWRGEDIGLQRDTAWTQAVSQVQHGLAVTADYCTLKADRDQSTLTGYRHGKQTAPKADSRTDITAHVAIDSAAAAADADHTSLMTQRQALQNLGITGARPRGSEDLVRRLQQMSDEAELIDRTGLGNFLWLAHSKGCALPPSLQPGMMEA